MIVDEASPKLVEHLSKLGLTRILIGGRRIRLDSAALEMILKIVDSLLAELGAYQDKTGRTKRCRQRLTVSR
jgi:hypothetical protein